MIVKPGQVVILRYKSPFGNTGLFPQAKIFDSATDTVVTGGTVNLAASAVDTSLYFVSYIAPSSEGKYSIIIQPFTDSGHTVKATDEGATIEDLIVQTIAKMQPTIMGGMDLNEEDLKRIEQSVSDGVAKLLEEKLDELKPKEVEEKEVDLTPVLKAIENIHMPEIPKTDYTPLVSLLREIKSSIKPVNDKPLLEAVNGIRESLNRLDFSTLSAQLKATNETMEQAWAWIGQFPKLLQTLATLTQVLQNGSQTQKKQVQDLVTIIKALGFNLQTILTNGIATMQRAREMEEMDEF